MLYDNFEKCTFPSWTLAAILDLEANNRSNYHNNNKYEFLDPENAKNDILHDIVGRTMEELISKMADGGHFEFWRLTELAHTFTKGMGANFCIQPS